MLNKRSYKIEGLLDYVLKSKDFKLNYEGNDKYNTTIKEQKAFLKEIGYTHIEKLINKILKENDYNDIECQIITKKYNKSFNDRYIKLDLIDNSNNIYKNKFVEIEKASWKVGNDILKFGLMGLFEVWN